MGPPGVVCAMQASGSRMRANAATMGGRIGISPSDGCAGRKDARSRDAPRLLLCSGSVQRIEGGAMRGGRGMRSVSYVCRGTVLAVLFSCTVLLSATSGRSQDPGTDAAMQAAQQANQMAAQAAQQANQQAMQAAQQASQQAMQDAQQAARDTARPQPP